MPDLLRLDGVAAAARQAETFTALRPRKAVAGSFQWPAEGVAGLPAPLFGDMDGP